MEKLHLLSVISLSAAGICALIIVVDLVNGHKQMMFIMNVVWPVTALYGGPFALIAYYFIGRHTNDKKTMGMMHHNHAIHMAGMHMKEKPFWQSVVKGALHCGSGCTLGDIIAEFGLLLFAPFTIWGSTLYGAWLVDFIIAFLIGIIFQYCAIKPMKKISAGQAILAALKADTLSLTFWQIGMYGWMAIATFKIFHQRIPVTSPVFWLMMQIGMTIGFFTAYPVNWWLIKKGIKERM